MKELFLEKGIGYQYYDIQSLPSEERLAIKKRAKNFGLKKFPIVELPNGQLTQNEDLIRQLQGGSNENY